MHQLICRQKRRTPSPSQEEETMFKTNVGGVDRLLRIFLGVVLIGLALTKGMVWGWIGVVPLVTGLFSTCPLYSLLGIKTCKTQ